MAMNPEISENAALWEETEKFDEWKGAIHELIVKLKEIGNT